MDKQRQPRGRSALEQFMTVTQAAAAKGITVQGINKAIRTGRLPAYPLGEGNARRWILRKADVEAFTVVGPGPAKKGESDGEG